VIIEFFTVLITNYNVYLLMLVPFLSSFYEIGTIALVIAVRISYDAP